MADNQGGGSGLSDPCKADSSATTKRKEEERAAALTAGVPDCIGAVRPPSGPPYLQHLTPLLQAPLKQVAPHPCSSWSRTWDQQPLANSFSTIAVTPTTVTHWVADSNASNHTTPGASNLTTFQPLGYGPLGDCSIGLRVSTPPPPHFYIL
jgi:hypothetical protein